MSKKEALVFVPSGPGHHFRVKNGPGFEGYVDFKEPGPVEVTKEQAAWLLADYPENFKKPKPPKPEDPEGKKSTDPPVSNKAVAPPGKNKLQRLFNKGGGD